MAVVTDGNQGSPPDALPASSGSPSAAVDERVRIEGVSVRISTDAHELVLVLNDSPTAQDFLSRLPTTIEFEDYSGLAKRGWPDPELAAQGTPSGITPVAGDFTYYPPYGDIAIFYEDSYFDAELTIIGKITEGLNQLSSLEGSVNFELLAK